MISHYSIIFMTNFDDPAPPPPLKIASIHNSKLFKINYDSKYSGQSGLWAVSMHPACVPTVPIDH